MNIELEAVVKTVQQVVMIVAVIVGVYMILTRVPVDVLAIALVAVCAAGFLYMAYLINLSSLKDKQDEELASAIRKQAMSREKN